MAQRAPGKFRLTEKQTNELIFRLEERKYGRRLSSMELAQKANVSLDYVNCVENQLPVDDGQVLERIGHALGISADLLRKIAGFVEITDAELQAIEDCFSLSPDGANVPPTCDRLGFQRVYR